MPNLLAPFEKIWARGGLKSPWSRTLVVDPDGYGDYTTIAAALAHAVAAVPTNTLRWTIRVLNGTYTETGLVIPSYVTVRGDGSMCRIQGGTIEMQGLSTLRNANVLVAHPYTAAIRIVGNLASGSVVIDNCLIQMQYASTIEESVSCVETTGTNINLVQSRVYNSYFYCRNTSNGATSTAANVRIMPGGPALYAYNCMMKLSAGPSGTCRLIQAWNQGSHAYAQIFLDGVGDVYNRPSFYDLYSENTAAQYGGRINLPHTGWIDEYSIPPLYGIPQRLTYDVGAQADNSHMRHAMLSVDTTTLTVDGASVGADPPLTSALWYVPCEWAGNTGTSAVTVNTARTFPIRFRRRTTVNAVRLDASSGVAGAVARVALYADDGAGNPGARIQELGTVSGAATNSDLQIAATVIFEAATIYHVYVGIEVAAATWRTITGNVDWLPQTGSGLTMGHTANHTTGSTPTTFVASGYSGAPIRVQFRPA